MSLFNVNIGSVTGSSSGLVTLSEFEAAQSDFLLYAENINIDRSAQQVLIALEAFNSMQLVKENKATVALEGYDHLGSSLAVGTDLAPATFINQNMSLEALMSHRRTFASMFFHILLTNLEKTVEAGQHAFSLFEFQTRRLRNVENEIKKSAVSRKAFRFRSNKWMRFGDKRRSVYNVTEYINELKAVVSVLTDVNAVVTELVDKELLSFFKWVSSGLTGNSDSFIEDHVRSSERAFRDFLVNRRMKNYQVVNGSKLYASEVLLGLFQVEAKGPVSNVDLSFTNFNFYEAHIERVEKFNFQGTTEQIDFEMTREQALELLGLAHQLLSTTKQLESIVPRLRSGIALLQSPLAPAIQLTIQFTKLITKSGRVMEAMSRTVHSCMASSYNIGFGNTSQIVSVLQHYAKE